MSQSQSGERSLWRPGQECKPGLAAHCSHSGERRAAIISERMHRINRELHKLKVITNFTKRIQGPSICLELTNEENRFGFGCNFEQIKVYFKMPKTCFA